MDIVLLREQLEQSPPNTEYIKQILDIFKEALFKFVPNKPEIHQFIKDDLPLDVLDTPTIANIVDRLIHWIEQFQAPIHDSITRQWREDFKLGSKEFWDMSKDIGSDDEEEQFDATNSRKGPRINVKKSRW